MQNVLINNTKKLRAYKPKKIIKQHLKQDNKKKRSVIINVVSHLQGLRR